jgi:hypothetical protein
VAGLTDLDELKVPKAIRPVVDEIIGITDEACLALLDEEYADLARRAVAKLARKRPSPLTSGGRTTWAGAVVYALGQVNFLFDPTTEPCVTTDELANQFGVAKASMSSKAKKVRDLIGIDHFSPEFLRADVIASTPFVWMIQLNDLVIDVRQAHLEIQAEAFRQGVIPYIPALGPDGTQTLLSESRRG